MCFSVSLLCLETQDSTLALHRGPFETATSPPKNTKIQNCILNRPQKGALVFSIKVLQHWLAMCMSGNSDSSPLCTSPWMINCTKSHRVVHFKSELCSMQISKVYLNKAVIFLIYKKNYQVFHWVVLHATWNSGIFVAFFLPCILWNKNATLFLASREGQVGKKPRRRTSQCSRPWFLPSRDLLIKFLLEPTVISTPFCLSWSK